MPIYVDEDCHTLGDVAACSEIAHGITIKLAKSGGIREAIRIVLMTEPGERLRIDGFGGGLPALLFEPNTTLLFGDAKDSMGKLLNAVKAL